MNDIVITDLIVGASSSVLVISLVVIFNNIVSYAQSVKSAKSSIQVELKKRLSLIPQVVDTAKKFISHEKELMESLTKMRQNLLEGDENNLKDMLQKEQLLTGALFAVAEEYPVLRSSEAFINLQNIIDDTENNIAASRHIYNSNVDIYNSYIGGFPALILAFLFGYKEEEYLEFDENLEKDPDIKKLFD